MVTLFQAVLYYFQGYPLWIAPITEMRKEQKEFEDLPDQSPKHSWDSSKGGKISD